MSEDAGFELDEDQKCLIDYLTETLIWLKYPTPNQKSKDKWDEFHDVLFEKLLIRLKVGSTYRTIANLKRIPSLDNYMSLWNICLAKYKESINDR